MWSGVDVHVGGLFLVSGAIDTWWGLGGKLGK